MKTLSNLPEGYENIYSVDLQNDKKAALIVNLLAVAIAILLVVPMAFIVPISALFEMESGLANYFIRLGSLCLFSVLYMVLHEIVHGIAMKICGTQRVKYGFTGLYAFAGSDDYYSKGAYLFIALAPVVLWGVVLAIVTPLVSLQWFWVVYFVQVINLSGAAGDIFVTVKFSAMPKDILIKDHGTGMAVYRCSSPE